MRFHTRICSIFCMTHVLPMMTFWMFLSCCNVIVLPFGWYCWCHFFEEISLSSCAFCFLFAYVFWSFPLPLVWGVCSYFTTPNRYNRVWILFIFVVLFGGAIFDDLLMHFGDQNGGEKSDLTTHFRHMAPQGAQMTPKWSQKVLKWSPKAPQGTQNGLQMDQNDAQRVPKAHKMMPMVPKGSPGYPKWYPNGPKWCPKGP